MAYGLTNSEHYEDIASAIRTKNGKTDTYKPGQMADAIRAITGGSEYDLEIPTTYKVAVDAARKEYYAGDFADVMIMHWRGESDSTIAIVFLMDNFEIRSFNPLSTEFTAIGWYSCYCNQSTGMWQAVDYRNTVSKGGNYLKNVEFASRVIEYNDETLWPEPVSNMAAVQSVIWNDANRSANIVFANSEVVPMTWAEDANGNVTSVTIDGHTITSTEVS